MIRVQSEEQVLADQKLRKLIIEEIMGPENVRRKDESYRRHQCYKDRTSIYVIDELLKQFDDDTVREMNYSLSNISIAKKIIDKLARVYTNGVQRTAEPASAQKAVDGVAKLVSMNKIMKRTNRYLRSQHNTIVGTLPCPSVDNGVTKYEIKVQAFQPHLYDVIEDPYDREKPMFVILSDYQPISPKRASIDAAKEGRGYTTLQPRPVSDGKDQAIADKKEDENQKEFIWWSKHFHFTTNEKGEFIKVVNPDKANPIIELPFDNFAIDQENSFWAEGGNDIFDGAVRVNCMITNMDHIGVTQGYGQFWMKGKNLPKNIKAGVNKAILLEVETKDDPDPSMGFASSDPKLQELKDQVVMYVALLLTTNNLSTKSMSTELDASQDVASGVSLLIDKAESVEDVQDQREIFQEKEPKIFQKIQKWQGAYKDVLTDEFKEHVLPDKINVTLKFVDARPVMSEKEKLEVIELRQKLGINTMVDLIMIDDPSLTVEQAEERLMKVLEDKIMQQIKAQAQAAAQGANNPDKNKNPEDPENPDKVDDEEEDPDDESDKGAGKLK